MQQTGSLEDMSSLKSLARRLAGVGKVKELSDNEHDEAWVLAHAFSDMEEASSKLFGELLPQLMSEKVNSEEAYDLLLDIGEELRHILYHIRDPRFYRYLDSSE